MRRLTAASSLVIIVVSSIAGASAQPAMPDYSLYSPIYELSVRLGSRYAKCITVEDAALVWRGEMRRIGLNKDGVEVFGPQPFSLILPGDSPVFSAPALNAAVIQQALDIYARQNPGRTTYKVLESSLGFHIVPAAAHDETGAMHPVRSLLDTPVDVLPAMRTATEHVQAVVNSLSQSTGLAFGEVWNFDGFYAANG